MRDFFSNRGILLLISLVLFTLQECASLPEFSCPSSPGLSIPDLPKAYSSDIRLNFPKQLFTAEIKHFIDEVGQREAIEFRSPDRRVKYIRHKKQVALVKYSSDGVPKCTMKSDSTIDLEDEDAGPKRILQKIADVAGQRSKFIISNPANEAGIYMNKWEGCFKEPKINVSMGFTDTEWKHPRKSASLKEQKYIVLIEAQIDDDFVIGVFDDFNPTMPDDVNFQPPEDVYCEGFRKDVTPPEMPDYFSYNAELMVYESSEGIAPVVSRRTVYYDYPSRIVRTDFYDPLAENPDMFSKITASGVSIIHDFNSSIQYNIEPSTGKCYIEGFKVTVNVAELKETKDSELLTGVEFFSLHTKKTSYNGLFMTRGYLSDVYTAIIPHLDGSEGKSLYTWYFSNVRTQIVEPDKVENKVLLRMVIRPEAAVGYEGRVDVNFYNFEIKQPNYQVFDLATCYNESTSKTFVLTFPANDALKGSEKMLKLPIHLALIQTTGLSKQRLFVSEVSFNKKYMFVEFRIFDDPSVLDSKAKNTKLSLSEAIAKIKKSISDNKFKVSVTSDDGVIELKPEPNGFNELGGDRKLEKAESPYKEGSVIALTVGMLFLGFILGGITLNLIVSRKFGVSLFQRSNANMNRFDNPLNESGM